jgi:hypothetical protein
MTLCRKGEYGIAPRGTDKGCADFFSRTMRMPTNSSAKNIETASGSLFHGHNHHSEWLGVSEKAKIIGYSIVLKQRCKVARITSGRISPWLSI